jgi:hypothetical protein
MALEKASIPSMAIRSVTLMAQANALVFNLKIFLS